MEEGENRGEDHPGQVGAHHDLHPGQPVHDGSGEGGQGDERDDLGQHGARDAYPRVGEAEGEQGDGGELDDVAPLADRARRPQSAVAGLAEHRRPAPRDVLVVHGYILVNGVPGARAARSARELESWEWPRTFGAAEDGHESFSGPGALQRR
ncbi:MAG: hypothetical protein ACYCUG_09885 [Acidimicrobiales bacterium]